MADNQQVQIGNFRVELLKAAEPFPVFRGFWISKTSGKQPGDAISLADYHGVCRTIGDGGKWNGYGFCRGDGQGILRDGFQRDQDNIPGVNPVDIADIRIESFKNLKKPEKILFGDFSLLPENFVNPIVFLNHIRITEKIISLVAFYHISLIPEGGIHGRKHGNAEKH